MTNPSEAPWRMKRHMGHIVTLKQQLLSYEFVYISRETNEMIDVLAKSGMTRQHDLVALFDV